MEEIINTVSYLKDFYNNSFEIIFINISLLLLFSLILYYILKKMNKEHDERWDNYFVAVKKEVIQLIAEFAIVFMVFIVIRDSFNINILDLIKRNEIWKMIVGFWLIYHLKNGRSTYQYINYEVYLDRIKDEDKNPKLQFEFMINQYQSNYDLELEKLGILKSLAPVSLIPLAAGFILENKRIAINLNTYTIIFFCILFLYMYNLWKCYDTLRFWRSRQRKVEERIIKLKRKSAESY